jgi:hypothetical protein
MTGANEVPPVPSAATGTVSLTLSGTSVSYTISASGLSGNTTGAHIHVISAAGTGPVVVNFLAITPAPSPSTTFSVSGSFTAANITNPTSPPLNPAVVTLDDLIAAIRAGTAYANIHTATNPGGEIRGTLVVQ